MNEFAIAIQCIVIRAGSQIALFVNIEVPIVVDETENSNIEFPALVKHWFFNIFLYYVGIAFLLHQSAHELFV